MDAYNIMEKLLEEKIEKSNTADEKKGCEIIKKLLKNKESFFMMPVETTFGIFEFLGVTEEESVSLYVDLISMKNFKNNVPKIRQDISENINAVKK